MSKWDFQDTSIAGYMEHMDRLAEDPNRMTRSIFQSPTGSGKSRMAAKMMNIKLEKISGGERLLFVADQINLVEQTYDAFTELGLNCGILQGDKRVNLLAPVQIASVQTLPNRKNLLDRHGISFPYQWWDEAHCLYDSAKKLMGDSWVCGMTATPLAKGMDKWYDSEVFVAATYKMLMDSGVLVGLTGWEPEKEFDTTELVEIKSGRDSGEYTTESSSEQFKTQIAKEVVPFWLEKGMSNKKTIVFVPTIDDSEILTGEYIKAGYNAYAYHSRDVHHEGKQRKDARDKAALDSFKQWSDGDDGTQVMVTVDRFIKGVDVADAVCGVLARPIKTEMKLWQLVGRIMRSAPGKDIGYLLDMCGNMQRVGWPMEMDYKEPKLKGGKRKKGEKDANKQYLMSVKDHEPKVTEIITKKNQFVEATRFINRHRRGINFEGIGSELKDFCDRNGLAYKEEEYKPPKLCIGEGCGALMPPGARVCSVCGFEHDAKPEKTIVSADVAMKEIKLPEMSKNEQKALRFYQGLKGYAQARGFKPAYADIGYKEHYGSRVPDAWRSREGKPPTKAVKEFVKAKQKAWREKKKQQQQQEEARA